MAASTRNPVRGRRARGILTRVADGDTVKRTGIRGVHRGLTVGIAALFVACAQASPPGIECSNYEPCPALDGSSCPDGTGCMAAPGCETPICISDEQWCERSCPQGAGCDVAQSLPALPGCDGMVPGTAPSLGPLECPAVVPWEGRACTHAPDDDCVYELSKRHVQSCDCYADGWLCASDTLTDAGTP